MQPYQIVLLVILSVVFVYLVLLLIALTNAIESKHKLARQLEALVVILLEQERVISLVLEELKKKGLCEEKHIQEFEKLRKICLNDFDEESFRQGHWVEEELENQLLLLSHGEAGKALQESVDRLRSLQKSHRHMCVLYNSELNAYSYWIRFLPTRPICYLVGLRKKERLD